MNIKEIKEMISLMNENGLSELEIEKDGLKLRLKKGASEIEQEFSIAPNSQPSLKETRPIIPQPQPGQSQEPRGLTGLIEIKSPMVGTFYRAPAPDTAPYIQEGQEINVGQVVCIVEAMKLMNEIKSEIKGKVVRVLIDNADPVEFGQTLFLIEPNK